MSRLMIDNKYKKGFWIDIADIEVLSHFLIMSFEKNEAKEVNEDFSYIYDKLITNRAGINHKMTNLSLYFIETEDDTQLMIKILADTKPLIKELGELITVDYINNLNQYRDKTQHWKWTKPIYTSSYLKIIDILIQMLKNEWQSDNHSVWVKGHAPKGFEET